MYCDECGKVTVKRVQKYDTTLTKAQGGKKIFGLIQLTFQPI